MFSYPKKLTKKDLKKISKYDCDDQLKDAYLKYLTNYSFTEFVKFFEDNPDENLENIIFKFTDMQLEKFEPNSLIWLSHVMINFLIYFDVNLDYEMYYDAYASALQFTVLFYALKIAIDKVSFDSIQFPSHSKICFEQLFDKAPDFESDLKKDCSLAYSSFNQNFVFTDDEFYTEVKKHFDDVYGGI